MGDEDQVTTLLEDQIIDLLYGFGSSEDVDDVLLALTSLGISQPTAEEMLRALSGARKPA